MSAPFRPALAILLIPLVTVLGALAGFALGLPWLLPLLCAAPGCAALWGGLSRGTRGGAILLVLLWAGTLAVTLTWLSFAWNDRAAQVILNGPAYRDEMRAWILTGQGREASPALFIPQHLMHLGTFAALSLATAGAAGLVMGSVLLGYMSFYVGDLAHGASHCAPAWAALLAWNPWSIVRVVSFIVLGVVLAEPLLSRRTAVPPGSRRGWIAAALAGAAADIVLKTALAPAWSRLLSTCLG